MRRQQARALPFLDLLGYEEAVKTRQSVGSQTDARVKDGNFDWQKGVGFSSHGCIIGRYIPKSQEAMRSDSFKGISSFEPLDGGKLADGGDCYSPTLKGNADIAFRTTLFRNA